MMSFDHGFGLFRQLKSHSVSFPRIKFGFLSTLFLFFTSATLAGWNCDCSNRKLIELDNSASAAALNNYQIRIDIVYEAEMNADFSDIRFTAADGQTKLDYWIETYQISSLASVWVKVPTIAASSITGIYLYYVAVLQ